MKNYRIHILRHGDAHIGEPVVEGKDDFPLSPEGLAGLLRLKDNLFYPTVGQVYSSPAKRCVQTASVIYPDAPIILCDDLRGCDFGIFAGKKLSSLSNDPDYLRWVRGEADPPEGEPSGVFAARCRDAFQQVLMHMMAQEIFEAAVFTHGEVIMALMAGCGLPRATPAAWVTECGYGYTVHTNAAMWMRDGGFEIVARVPYAE